MVERGVVKVAAEQVHHVPLGPLDALDSPLSAALLPPTLVL